MEKKTSFHTVCRLVLRELRQERNVQQRYISQLLGKTASAWSKVETGETPLALEHIVAACTVFVVGPADLLRTAQDYVELLRKGGWDVAASCAAVPRTQDLLGIEAERYYATHSFRRTWDGATILPTAWPGPEVLNPVGVFRWILDRGCGSRMGAASGMPLLSTTTALIPVVQS